MQKQVARRMCVTQATVSNLERQYHTPSLDRVLRYADAIGVELVVRPKGVDQ